MKLASGIAPVPRLLKEGVCVALGTDGASSNNNLDMLEEINLAAMLHKVSTLDPLAVPARTALKMGTEYGAKAVRLAEKLREGLKEKGYQLLFNSTTNQTFVKLPDDKYQTLSEKVGMSFWEKPDDNHTIVRLATSWATTEEDVDALLALM